MFRVFFTANEFLRGLSRDIDDGCQISQQFADVAGCLNAAQFETLGRSFISNLFRHSEWRCIFLTYRTISAAFRLKSKDLWGQKLHSSPPFPADVITIPSRKCIY